MTRFASCRWMPFNEPSAGPVTAHRGLVIHRRGGVSDSKSFWFCTPSDDLHATFSVDLDGTASQHIDDDRHTVLLGASGRCYSLVELAGTGALSPPQVEGLASIYAEGHRRYGWPLAVTHAPGEAGLLSHGSGGLAFAAHPDCPGRDLVASFDAVLARAQELLDPATAASSVSPTSAGPLSPVSAPGPAEADPDPTTTAAVREDGDSPQQELVSPQPEHISVALQTRPPLDAQAGWGRRWLPH